jgi:hypothetical protein
MALISLVVVSSWGADETVTSGSVSVGGNTYAMTKLDGITPDTYTVTIPLSAGNYNATCTLVGATYGSKTSSATTFRLTGDKNVTFWGRFPSGKNWAAILSNASEYGMMNDKWRYWFFTAPNYDAADPEVCETYFNAYGDGYTFQPGTSTKAPSNEYLITANSSGNPPFTAVKTSATAGIKKAVLTYAQWRMEAVEATELPVKIGSTGVATLCAPADLTIPKGVKAYKLEYVGGALKAHEVTTTIPANTPVLLNAAADNYSFAINAESFNAITDNYSDEPYMPDVTTKDYEYNVLYGVLQPHYVPTNAYVLQDGEHGIGFYNVGSTANYRIKPFRAYVKLPAATARALTIVYDDENTTGVKNVKNTMAEGSNEIYNLSGQRVGKDYKGVVIKNGRKMIQK